MSIRSAFPHVAFEISLHIGLCLGLPLWESHHLLASSASNKINEILFSATRTVSKQSRWSGSASDLNATVLGLTEECKLCVTYEEE